MRLPDPFTNPDLPGLGFDTAVLTDNDPVIRDELPNGRVSEVRLSAPFWSIEITYPDMFPDEFAKLNAFLLDYKRRRGTIDVILPQYESFTVKGATSGISIPAGQAGNTLVLNNTSSLIGTPKIGSIFKLDSHSKVYKVASINTTTNSWTIGVYPDLFKTTTGIEKPIFNGVLFITKLINGDTFKESLSKDGMYTGMSLQLREHIT